MLTICLFGRDRPVMLAVTIDVYSGCDDSPSCDHGCEVIGYQASGARQRFGAGRTSDGLGNRAIAS
jgi:hypothetical protein